MDRADKPQMCPKNVFKSICKFNKKYSHGRAIFSNALIEDDSHVTAKLPECKSKASDQAYDFQLPTENLNKVLEIEVSIQTYSNIPNTRTHNGGENKNANDCHLRFSNVKSKKECRICTLIKITLRNGVVLCNKLTNGLCKRLRLRRS